MSRAWFRSMRVPGAAIAALSLVASITAVNAADNAPSTAKASSATQQADSADEQTLYALGVLMSRNIESFQLSSSELKIVQQGLADGYNHRSKLDAQSYLTKVQTLQRARVVAWQQREKTQGDAYLAKAATLPGAQKTASGLIFLSLSEGAGESPNGDDRVQVMYEGKLINGTVFDSTAKHGGQAATLGLSSIIPCWTEALKLMKAGGKARVICPPNLAYGERGNLPDIPPQATLDFTIDLLSVTPTAAPASAPAPSSAPAQ